MFIYRAHKGEQQFYLLDRPPRELGGISLPEDRVVPTGHIGDSVTEETPLDAAKRELKEELGADPLSIIELDYQTETLLIRGTKQSIERGFLIEVDNQEFPFLEYLDITSSWHSLAELERFLTYESQRGAIPEIKQKLATK